MELLDILCIAMEEEKQQQETEPAFKKQKREVWSEEMINDYDILKRNESGMYKWTAFAIKNNGLF